MGEALFQPFRLVGGTALSLRLGHRMSIDIDMFTDTPYGSLDFRAIDEYLRKQYTYVANTSQGIVGMGLSYIVGNSAMDAVKLDLFYTDPYIHNYVVAENIRTATLEEIIAMKLDIIQRTGRKKDFWDIHALLEQYTVTDMIALHKLRYPYTHDEKLIVENFTNFSEADEDLDPVCLLQKYWELIKYEIAEAVSSRKDIT